MTVVADGTEEEVILTVVTAVTEELKGAVLTGHMSEVFGE